ncbi:hypothetical protein EC968_010392 [Mortierella alpina]|nr:hypothetical protein EC968_010392 [Mortierella alpina]
MPDPEKPTSNKPMPPITHFTPNPDLHKAFYGIDYNPAKALMPWCGVTLQNVVDDMILISQLTNRIRLYGMDCSQADLTFQAITALNLNTTMKVVLTLWVDKDPITYQRQHDTLFRVLDTYGTDMVQGISVGNEVLFRGDKSLADLGELMKTVRTTVKTRYNKSIPIFTSEIGNNLNASLAAISDELSGNFHPYFAGTGVDEAAKWTMLQYNITMETNPTSTGLKGAISEVGWPSAPASAVHMKYAVPGLANLQTMIDTFICQANAAGIPYYWFEFQDAAWKNDPKVPVEPYWGIFDKDKGLKIKPSTPSWSLSSIMEHRDRLSTSPDHSDDITPATIDHLLKLAHLCKPTDPDELQRLVRDVRRMKNFLDYIQSCDTQHQRLAADQSKPVESLRSLVDDGFGLEMRSDVATEGEDVDPGLKEQKDREAIRRRDVLLERPSRVKGNFFVVGTELDPKDSN